LRGRSLVAQVTAAAVVVAVVVAVAFIVAIAGILSLRHSTARETHSKDVVAATLEAQTLVVDFETGVRGYVLSLNTQFLEPYETAQHQWPSTIARLERLVGGDHEEEQRAHAVATMVQAYETDYASPIITIAKIAPSAARAPVATTEAKRRVDLMRGELSRILEVEAGRSHARAATAHSVARRAVVAGIVGLAASAALVLLFGAWVTRSVARPILRVSESAAAVAGGDFSTRVDELGAGELTTLAHAFNTMTRALEGGQRELLAQNERLRASEQAKSDLISMISHELRTPLSSVLGFTALLLDRDFDAAERRRYLEIVDNEARRLAELAEDFLDVQLLEEGRLELQLAPVDIAELVRSQARLFFAHARNHVVTVDVPEEPLLVPADRDRITQVVANLLSNAIKYSPGGGRITVSLRTGDKNVRLSVSDDGIGIARDHQQRIFEKFFRGSATNAGIPGTGLGLSVSRMIVEGHSGRIDFESKQGVGSTFWIELPLQARNATAAPLPAAAPPAVAE
jgi:signal transduction histidine kinase